MKLLEVHHYTNIALTVKRRLVDQIKTTNSPRKVQYKNKTPVKIKLSWRKIPFCKRPKNRCVPVQKDKVRSKIDPDGCR